jgi:hypothetical protein
MRLLRWAWNVQISTKARALIGVVLLSVSIGLLIIGPKLFHHVSDETVFVKITAWTGIFGIVAGVSSISKWMRDRRLIR